MAERKKALKQRRREKKNVPQGHVHIQATFNNTIITITDLNALLARDVDAGDAGHRLPLPLLVFRVGADDHHGAMATDHLAVVATGLDGGSDFQRILDCVLS